MAVSDKYVPPRKRDLSPIDLADELDKSDDCRNPKAPGYRLYDPVRLLHDFNFAVEEQDHRPFPRHYPEELVCSIQYNNRVHGWYRPLAFYPEALRNLPSD